MEVKVSAYCAIVPEVCYRPELDTTFVQIISDATEGAEKLTDVVKFFSKFNTQIEVSTSD